MMAPASSTATVGRQVPPSSKKNGVWPAWARTCSQKALPGPLSFECRESQESKARVASLLESAARRTARRPASLARSKCLASHCCHAARTRRWPMAHQSLYSRTCALKNMGCTPSANLVPSSSSRARGVASSCFGGRGAGPRKSLAALAMALAKPRSFSAVFGSIAAAGAPAAVAAPGMLLFRGRTSAFVSELNRDTSEARHATASAAETLLAGARGTARNRMLSAVPGVTANSS
mmetsp:Transcript_45069/g.140063  ORF Transcript_45069/g.140063 Transcript_45069/m.140063 type:complete len:235 (+) Transcript_45069:4520-5224(+)